MAKPTEEERRFARQARLVALVIAVTMTLWIGAQWLGSEIGLPVRYVFLFDLAALGAFIWALVVTYQLWRQRREHQG